MKTTHNPNSNKPQYDELGEEEFKYRKMINNLIPFHNGKPISRSNIPTPLGSSDTPNPIRNQAPISNGDCEKKAEYYNKSPHARSHNTYKTEANIIILRKIKKWGKSSKYKVLHTKIKNIPQNTKIKLQYYPRSLIHPKMSFLNLTTHTIFLCPADNLRFNTLQLATKNRIIRTLKILKRGINKLLDRLEK